MSMNVETPGIHHLALRVSDLARSRRFYAETLGFPVALEGPGIFLFLAGQTAIAVRGPEAATPAGDIFNPFRVGLDHVALGCRDERELTRVADALDRAGVDNTGVRLDPTLNRQYVAFKDPDRISWELYMAPDAARQAALSYFHGLRTQQVDGIPFAADVRFESPCRGPATGPSCPRATVAIHRTSAPVVTRGHGGNARTVWVRRPGRPRPGGQHDCGHRRTGFAAAARRHVCPWVRSEKTASCGISWSTHAGGHFRLDHGAVISIVSTRWRAGNPGAQGSCPPIGPRHRARSRNPRRAGEPRCAESSPPS